MSSASQLFICDPFITIGIPVYNVEAYVEKALNSALNQSFSLPYEVLVIDDCGTDQSMSVVNCVREKHPRGSLIRIIKHENNKGLGTAKNTIIDEAHGRYLFFLDADDWLAEDALSSLYSVAVENNADMVYGQIVFTNIEAQWRIHEYPDLQLNQVSAGLFLLSNGICVPNIYFAGRLWSVDFMRQHGIRCCHRIMEDSIPDAMSLFEAKRVSTIHKDVYYYYQRPNSITQTVYQRKGSEEAIAIYVDILTRIRRMIEDKYRRVYGAYDLYMQRVRYSLGSLIFFPDENHQSIDKQIENCLQFIPNIRYLHNKHDRLVYFCCNRCVSLERYKYVTEQLSQSFFGRVLRNLLNLIPCKKY